MPRKEDERIHMHAWRDDDLHTWLINEDRDESDIADAAFGRLMQTLPLERPRADFTDVVLAAWKATRRAARRLRLARLAAMIVFGTLTALASIAVLHSAGGSLI